MNLQLPDTLATLWYLIRATIREVQDDDCTHMAAGIAYYALFSLFPLLLGIIAIAGVVLQPGAVQEELLDQTTALFPGSKDLVAMNVDSIVASRQTLGLISLLGLLWSGSAIFAAIRRSVNRAWDVEKERPMLKQKLVEFTMMAVVGVAMLGSLLITTVFRVLLGLDLREAGGLAAPLATIGAFTPLVVDFLAFSAIYRLVPNTVVSWRDVWPGALLAAVLFELGKNVFLWYLTERANYTLIYGSLASVIAFLFWAYLSALILLIGAELAAEYSRLPQRQRSKQQ